MLCLPKDRPETDLGRALIARDGSSACVRAISAWMSSGVPLKDAVLLHVADPHEDLPESASVQEHLAWHGIHSEVATRPKRAEAVGSVLLDAAADLQCGLHVMGGYGHFRNWEAVFGGVTRYMIRHARLPLLMMH